MLRIRKHNIQPDRIVERADPGEDRKGEHQTAQAALEKEDPIYQFGPDPGVDLEGQLVPVPIKVRLQRH